MFPVQSFENGIYHLCVYGPNGFFREYKGKEDDPEIDLVCEYERPDKLIKKNSGNILLKISNVNLTNPCSIQIRDNAYKDKTISKIIPASKTKKGQELSMILNLDKSFGWYDFSVLVEGDKNFERRYAGHVETGKESRTDPVLGGR